MFLVTRFRKNIVVIGGLRDPTKERTRRPVIDLILTQFPELESKISWNVPTIHRNGKYVVGLAAYKHHLTFSAWSPRVIEDFKMRLGKFKVWNRGEAE